jgi:proteasome lid subunit RPN8/RPN11
MTRETTFKPTTLRNPDPWGPEVVDAIKAHAMAEYPRESCGIVVGDQYVPCENIHPEPLKAFRIDPDITDPLTVAGTLQAIVHSHPDGPNFASEADQQGQIDMDIPWGIVPVIGNQADAVVACDILWWGDSLPVAPLERRMFIWGIFHCYELYRHWMKLNRGVLPPTFACPHDFIERNINFFTDHIEASGHINLGKPDICDLQVGDILIGKLYGKHPNHCGVYVGDDMILHHPAGGASGYTELLRWWPKVEVVCRYDPAHASSVRGLGEEVREKSPRSRRKPS